MSSAHAGLPHRRRLPAGAGFSTSPIQAHNWPHACKSETTVSTDRIDTVHLDDDVRDRTMQLVQRLRELYGVKPEDQIAEQRDQDAPKQTNTVRQNEYFRQFKRNLQNDKALETDRDHALGETRIDVSGADEFQRDESVLASAAQLEAPHQLSQSVPVTTVERPRATAEHQALQSTGADEFLRSTEEHKPVTLSPDVPTGQLPRGAADPFSVRSPKLQAVAGGHVGEEILSQCTHRDPVTGQLSVDKKTLLSRLRELLFRPDNVLDRSQLLKAVLWAAARRDEALFDEIATSLSELITLEHSALIAPVDSARAGRKSYGFESEREVEERPKRRERRRKKRR